MKTIFYSLVCFIGVSCNNTAKKDPVLKSIVYKIDTPKIIEEVVSSKYYSSPFDSLVNVVVDTSTLASKREYILNHFIVEIAPTWSDYDTLFDINYDGKKDYIIGYYGLAGTGVKNRIAVYLYNKKNDGYILNEQLTRLSNPTFYINKKKITSFYIGHGGGEGCRLEWIKGKWRVTKEFTIDNEGIWQINYPLKHKKEKIVRPFQMTPPKDILETQYGN